VVRLSEAAARAASKGDTREGACMRALAILQAPSVLTTDEGGALDPMTLPVRDAHVLRALLSRAGVVEEEAAEFTCQNCEAPFRVAPSSLLEVGPFVDGELQDPELDGSFDHERSHAIPPVRVGGAVARAVRIAPRTVEQALPLWRAEGQGPLRITPAIVTAMGVVALGRERRSRVLADALADASPEAFRAVADLLHAAHYPPRLFAVHRCEACGARNDLDVPLACEIPYEPLDEGSRDGRERPGFPDLDAFEAMVREAADRVYRARRVRNVDLFIDAGVPFCDDGGEPLLGCYTPGGADPETGVPRAPELRVFYRTFAEEYRADPSFDLKDEIRETIDHEVTHHLHHLAGSDPLDDEERAEIEKDELRRVGQREAVRRAGKGAASEIAGFLRATWPIWVLLLIGTWLAFGRSP
jgi:hypothetical protein